MKPIHAAVTYLLISLFIMFVSCEQQEDIFAPVLDFEIHLDDSIAPAQVSFLNTSDPLDRYEWDFGDGHVSGERSPNHLYANAGEFIITLTGWYGQQPIIIRKNILLTEGFQYYITNDSDYLLYNLISFTGDSSHSHLQVCHGLLTRSGILRKTGG